VSPGVGGERGSVVEFREKGVQLGNDLCALADGSGNALDRTRAHITVATTPGRLVSGGL